MAFSGDLFGDPEWPLFGGGGRTPGGHGPVLAAVSLETRAEGWPWERAVLVEANAREVAGAVFGSPALSSHRAFLFVAHALWQPTGGRLARYMLERNKLWRGLEKRATWARSAGGARRWPSSRSGACATRGCWK